MGLPCRELSLLTAGGVLSCLSGLTQNSPRGAVWGGCRAASLAVLVELSQVDRADGELRPLEYKGEIAIISMGYPAQGSLQ